VVSDYLVDFGKRQWSFSRPHDIVMTQHGMLECKLRGCDINTGKTGKLHCYRTDLVPARGLIRRCVAFTLVASLVCSQSFAQVPTNAADDSDEFSVTTIRLAQAGPLPAEIDIDPPIIDHEALEPGIAGEQQVFTAGVIDDRGLKHVMLFHRGQTGAQYQSAVMQKVEGSNDYTITIDTAAEQSRVEYYIEALDTGGNRVLKGFPFFPLVRELSPVKASVAEAPESSSSRNGLIYVLLGVAAIGIVAAVAGGGGGGDDGPEAPEPMPGDDTVPLTITVTPP